MGETAIEWSDWSWNPTRGCSRVSKGCEHCYAENAARRFSGPGQPYEGLVRLDRDGKAKAQWNGVVRLVPDHLGDPLRWKRPRRVFVNSMSDLFHEALAFEHHIASVFGVMAAAPQHTFQVLTKRPENARAFFEWAAKRRGERWREATGDWPTDACLDWARNGCPMLPTVWLGVSVEDQATADERIPHLLACPAAVRWVSYEPAIGPVDFTRLRLVTPTHPHDPTVTLDALRGHVAGPDEMLDARLGWIVVGGESGLGARPFDLAWARSTIAQCRAAGVACFVKQLGASPRVWTGERGDTPDVFDLPELRLRDRKGGDIDEWPKDLRVRQWPEVRRG